jgi:serine/threonine protein kinase/WD40 repeat protein
MQEQSLFIEALEIEDPTKRTAFLDRACATDPILRQRLERLLQRHGQADSFLESPAANLPCPPPTRGVSGEGEISTIDNTIVERPGAIIGPYKVMEQIGEGGMGLVFVAEQQYPVRRKVALKLIKPGMDSRQVIARFEAERQALALMDHPNIAKVLDGGATASGRPYFVMELVKGVPITEYCDQNQVPVGERLELFLDVCHAVEHAHQKGIIHRDIKPSNVLIMSQDGTPLVKVIDFGVAKAVGQQLTDKTIYTQFTQLVGTPSYMSPEQAGQSGVDVDTRSDIYSLGVLLYELLTGTTPVDKDRLKEADYDEIRRIIREDEPAKPSTRISTLGQAATTVSTNRQSDPQRLRRLLRGELDWIVMKALEKDRNRRYETASAFAADMQRYLRDEAVLACPPAAWYRFRKFARRNKAMLVTGALVAATMLVGTVVSTWQWGHARQSEKLAQRRLEAAEREQERAGKAERDAQHRLYGARLAEARASRWSGRIGQRFQSLQALSEAARIARELDLGEPDIVELRNEAIACLALPDMRLVRSWNGYPPGSTQIAFDPDFKHYARSDGKGDISVRRIADDQEVAAIRGPDTYAYGLRFSRDGRFLASLHHRTYKSFVWDVASGKALLDLGWDRVLAFSPDCRYIAVAHAPSGGISLVELRSGREGKRIAAGERWIAGAFDPAGKRLAFTTATRSGSLRIYDLDADTLREFPLPYPLAHPDNSWVAWSPDGTLLGIWREGGNICIIDPQDGAQQAVLRPPQGERPADFDFNRTGDLLASAGPNDSSLRLWDPWTGRQLLSKSGPGVFAPQFSPDGRSTFCVNGSNAELWEVATGREACASIKSPSRRPGSTAAAFSADARFIALSGAEGVSLCDAKTNREIAFLPCTGTHQALFHPDGNSVFVCTTRGLYRWPIKSEAIPLGQRLVIGPPRLLGDRVDTHEMSLSQDGRLLAVSDHTNGLGILLDLEADKNAGVRIHHKMIAGIALSPDGHWLATGTWWGELAAGVKIWETRSGKLACDLPREAVGLDATIAFSPDGEWLVTATNRDYRLWKVGSWDAGPIMPREIPYKRCLAFTHDGKILALQQSPSQINLVQGSTGIRLASLPVDDPNVMGLRFSSDDTRLAVCAGHYPDKIWDLGTLRKQLAAIGLDWDAPPYPPVEEEQDTTSAIAAVNILPGEAPQSLPRTAQDYNSLAWELVSNPNVSAADARRGVELATCAVEQRPQAANAWNTLGIAQYRAGNWHAAKTALEKSMSLQGANVCDLFFLAMTHWRLDERKAARELFERACQSMDEGRPLDMELRRFVVDLMTENSRR